MYNIESSPFIGQANTTNFGPAIQLFPTAMADSPKAVNVGHPQLASAVVIPEIPAQEESRSASPQHSTNGHTSTNTANLKRRASELPYDDEETSTSARDPDAKRARLHSAAPNGSPPARSQPTAQDPRTRPTRPVADSEADRKRGKRLFGSLLGTLSQSTSAGAAQKRRADAERRQRDKLAALSSASGPTKRPPHANSRDGEADEQPGSRRRTAQELAELEQQRRRQKQVWEEDEMRVRHASMRSRARFLCTKVEPRIYWLPYELTEREEDVLDDQKESVEDAIAKEEEDYRRRGADGDGDQVMGHDHTRAAEDIHMDGNAQEQASVEQTHPGDIQDSGERSENRGDGKENSEDVTKQDATEGATNDANEPRDIGEDDEEIPLNRDVEEDAVLY